MDKPTLKMSLIYVKTQNPKLSFRSLQSLQNWFFSQMYRQNKSQKASRSKNQNNNHMKNFSTCEYMIVASL